MNILLAASEVVPYAKTGGLADVAGALPKALARLGQSVKVIMPRYDCEPIKSRGERVAGTLAVPFASGVRRSAVYVDASGEAPVYFIDAPEYFSRSGLYGEYDDVERFAYFSRAALEFAKTLDEKIDVIHLNDWMTGLVAAYLRTAYAMEPAFAETKTLFTIHNLAFPGMFGRDLLSKIGLPDWTFTASGIEFYGEGSALKAGLFFSDTISTVSPRYSEEIQTSEFGQGFEGLLRARRNNLFGILNGVDYDEWNPATDRYIASNYSPDDLSGKLECKRDLLGSFGLPEETDRPVIGCISRLSDQKGFDLILEISGRMLAQGAFFVLLGSGAAYYEEAFERLRNAHPTRAGVYLGFSNELAHKIEAGADVFLMPSRYEPCGLNQMYSLKYGTVPVVRAAGGLDDTIENFDQVTGRGNGFKFYEYDPARLLEKIHEALGVYANRDLWRTLTLNAMQADFSWDISARHYIELYQELTRRGAAAAD